jgi:hypothetical protein
LGLFPDLPMAEAALRALQEADSSLQNVLIMPQILQPTPSIQDTEAKRSAGGGAIAGSVFGSMAGLLLGMMNVISPDVPHIDSAQVLIGMILAGAGVGAAGGSLIGALSGLKVPKGAAEPESAEATNYIIVAEQITPDQVIKAKALLQQQGSTLES